MYYTNKCSVKEQVFPNSFIKFCHLILNKIAFVILSNGGIDLEDTIFVYDRVARNGGYESHYSKNNSKKIIVKNPERSKEGQKKGIFI